MDNSEKSLKDLKWELHQAELDLLEIDYPNTPRGDDELDKWIESQKVLIQSLKDEINKRWDDIKNSLTVTGAQHILDNPEDYGLV